MGLLNGKGVERAVPALNALSSLAKTDGANQVAIAKAGGIPPMISWLSADSEEVQEEAANTLYALSDGNVTTQALIVKSEGISPLIEIIKTSRSDKAKEHSARCLWHLCSSVENQNAIMDAGGVGPLVAMLSGDGERSPELASVTIRRLAQNNPRVSEAIGDVGGIAPLVRLLLHGSSYSQQQAAACLAELALLPDNRDAIASAGGIEPLIRLLDVPTQGTAELAARCIGNLARDNSRVDAATRAALASERARSIRAAAEAAAPAVGQALTGQAEESRNPSPGDTRSRRGSFSVQGSEAARSSSTAAARSRRSSLIQEGPVGAVGVHAGVTGKAAELLPTVIGVFEDIYAKKAQKEVDEHILMRAQEAAEAARMAAAELASEDEDAGAIVDAKEGGKVSKDATESGGASTSAGDSSVADLPASPQLHRPPPSGGGERDRRLSLSRSKTSPGGLIRHKRNMFDGPMRRSTIREGGAVSRLITMLAGRAADSIYVRGSAANVDAYDGREGKELWANAALAFAKQQDAERDREDFTIEENFAGALDGLPQMDEAHALDMAEESAAALRELADGDEQLQDSIIEGGGATPLLALFQSADKFAQKHAANCIWHLCESVDNQKAVVQAGAIAECVALLTAKITEAFGSVAAQEAAAAALASLASGGEVNRLLAIADAGGIPPLITMITSGSVAGKEKAACALVNLALDPANQTAIARANGIPPLVSLLDFNEGTEATFSHVVDALARLASRDADNQSQIAKRLVVLLGTENLVAQMRSARALCNLAADQPSSRVLILNAGALMPLVKLLSSSNGDARSEASAALSTLATNNVESQLAIASGLVALLSSGANTAKPASKEATPSPADMAAAAAATAAAEDTAEHVTELLLRLCGDDVANAKAIAKAGGIPRLVTQLSSRRLKLLDLTIAVLAVLMTDEAEGVENGVECANAGGVKPLVALLTSTGQRAASTRVEADARSGYEAQSRVAATLCAMLQHSDASRKAVVSANGLTSIILLIERGHDHVAKAEAAGAVRGLALAGGAEQSALAEEGAIPVLVKLLASRNPRCLSNAAGALAALCAGHSSNQDAVTAAGAVQLLVSLLSDQAKSGVSGDDGDDEVSQLLGTDTGGGGAVGGRAVGGTGSLADEAMQEAWELVKTNACAALSELSRGHHANQTVVASTSVIGSLIKILKVQDSPSPSPTPASPTPGASLHGAASVKPPPSTAAPPPAAAATPEAILQKIKATLDANHARVTDLFREWDVSGDGRVSKAEMRKALKLVGHEVTAEEVSELFSRLDRDDSGEIEYKELHAALRRIPAAAAAKEAEVSAASAPAAVRALAIETVPMAAAGWKASPRPSPRSYAPATIAAAEESSRRRRVWMLRTKETAARALWTISDGHASNQKSVAEAGGISPLVTLLGSGNAEAEKSAAGALAAISTNNLQNEVTLRPKTQPHTHSHPRCYLHHCTARTWLPIGRTHKPQQSAC